MEEFIVSHWLKQIYGEDLPPFEVNSGTIQVLKQLFDQYKSSESGMSLILEQITEAGSDIKTELSRLNQILTSLHFTSDSLPSFVNDLLTDLTEVAVNLNAGITDLSFLYLLLSNHIVRIKDSDLDALLPLATINTSIGEKVLQMDKEISILKKKSSLVRENVELEKDSLLKNHSDIIFLQKKRKEYVDFRNLNEKLLEDSGFREEISHPTISSIRNEVGKLEARLSELRSRKHYYKALPLNLTLAKVRLEESKLELKRLNSEIIAKLNLNDR